MKYSQLMLVLAVCLAFSAAGQVNRRGEDAAITARIETMFLLNEHLNPFNINTSTEEGVVTLTGGVNDEIQKQLAEDLARGAKGVVEVRNHITIVPVAYSDKDRRGIRQKFVDKTTTAAVKANLLYNREFHGLKIGVETVNGVVTLHGNAYNEAQKKRIEEIAFETKGVERVINNLTIFAPDPVDDAVEHVGRQLTDEWLEARVETAILVNRHLSIRELDVEVEGGICFLSGNVDAASERDLAGSVAKAIKGVGEVRNQIQIRPGARLAPPATNTPSPLDATPAPTAPEAPAVAPPSPEAPVPVPPAVVEAVPLPAPEATEPQDLEKF
ncbi:MAG: BON domain-containing protein [Candidatus Hydrogenedentes bacterium]|nr:BON domain-containing protein [Candidatus Hydrogenedentota bacterium]